MSLSQLIHSLANEQWNRKRDGVPSDQTQDPEHHLPGVMPQIGPHERKPFLQRRFDGLLGASRMDGGLHTSQYSA
jgi:hypothetical protein